MKLLPVLKTSLVIIAGTAMAACNTEPNNEPIESTQSLDFENLEIRESYALGVQAGNAMNANLASLDGTDIVLNADVIAQGYADGISTESQMDEASLLEATTGFQTRVGAAMQAKREIEQKASTELAEANKKIGADYLAANKAKEGVVTLESGLQYKVIQAGTGKTPASTNQVKVHYVGTLIDGTTFDSSRERGTPATFGVTQVIKGWTEALQLMKEGSRWELTIPADLAYGPAGRPSIPGNSVLVFDVELLEVVGSE